MKKYIQITAGRGPVECARVVTLVARELLKAIPALQLTDCEPHNKADGCFMSMTFTTQETIPQSIVAKWQGTVLWRSTNNPYRPGHKRSNWFVGINFFDEVELPHIDESQNKSLARERLLLKLRQIYDKVRADSLSRQWSNHDSLERGNPVKKFSGPL